MSQTLSQQISEFADRRRGLMERIVVAARAVVPALKDHNLTHTAEQLEALFFELDAIEQTAADMARQNPQAFIDEVLRRLEKKQRGLQAP